MSFDARTSWRRAYRLARLTPWFDLRGRVIVASHPFGRRALRVVDQTRPAPVAVAALVFGQVAHKWLQKAIRA